MKFKSFADLISQVKGKSNRVVVPGANNKEALQAITDLVNNKFGEE